ncbi:DNA ligase [Pseudoalteromonas mariniglutinosa]|uniref:DNA ligase n=1 Tax=Pseudoalteromonas mariniglutinosa TaxID=206042 RepID=UPI00384DE724
MRINDMSITPLIVVLLCLLNIAFVAAESMPQTQLAKVYKPGTVSISHYLVSEKYDGVRAIWTGSELLTRNGNRINAPAWFTAPLPDVWLDGELWTKRQDFANLSGIVRTLIPNEQAWRTISYRVFDMPDTERPFSERYKNYKQLINEMAATHIVAVKQQQFLTNHELSEFVDKLVAAGAEGVMLHLAAAKHQGGRSNALLKLKPYLDDEAIVIAHLKGKGKYATMLGALRVKNKQGIEFSVGTGFSDDERRNPPPIGSTITYKYHGYTKNGLPRFASFLRQRTSE